MRLFAKIFAWFVVAVMITLFATAAASALSYNPAATARAPFGILIGIGLADARQAWEAGGHDALAQSLDRFRSVTRMSQVIFTDAQGTDLLTGAPRTDLVRNSRAWLRIPFLHPAGMVFGQDSSDHRYALFVVVSPRRLIASNLQPAHMLVLMIAALLCYWLADYLTEPLRDLSAALERFGQGSLDARAKEHRRDETGELAAAFNRMAERIQILLAAERRLLLDISHELRSPLARLSVAVELARSGQTRALPLDRIQKEADRLNELIGQMLQVTRAEGDAAHRRSERLELDELVMGVANDCSIEAAARGCSLVFPAPPRVALNGDRELLRRAVENVLRNAIRYAPPESKVEIAVQNGAGRACVRIRDHGPGVPAEALPKLFDPFYRVDADRNRSSGGVGLGLSIARRAVELHRGTLRAFNAFPGLLVEIDLPV